MHHTCRKHFLSAIFNKNVETKRSDDDEKHAINTLKSARRFAYLQGNRPAWEKLLWSVVLLGAISGAIFNGYGFWLQTRQYPLRTTVVSTYSKISKIPFPVVTVCDSSRVHWEKAYNLSISDLGLAGKGEESGAILDDVRKLLHLLGTAQFASSKDLKELRQLTHYHPALENVEVAPLLQQVARGCQDLFMECSWRNVLRNCCEIFEKQKSGFGLCYSFNSDTSDSSMKLSLHYGIAERLAAKGTFYEEDTPSSWEDWNGVQRPRITPENGPGTGLKFKIKAQSFMPFHQPMSRGMHVFVGDPSGYPYMSNHFVPHGVSAQMGVFGDKIIASGNFRVIPPGDRKCLFAYERRVLGRAYLKQNCVADCFKRFVEKNCHCSLDFLYNKLDDGPELETCKIKDLKCVGEYNFVFNSRFNSQYAEGGDGPLSFCSCPDDCHVQDYIARSNFISASKMQSTNSSRAEIFFLQSFCTLYKTDVAFILIDVLVSYGSIAALFLGASILRVAEFGFVATRFTWKYASNYIERNYLIYPREQAPNKILYPRELNIYRDFSRDPPS